MMQYPQSSNFSTSGDVLNNGLPVGMNDEEEMRRIGLALAGATGIGEVLVDYDDLRDLRNE